MENHKAIDYAMKGAIWLEKMIQDDGRIIYGYDAVTLKKNKGYNILRHAGSIWAMLELYDHIPLPKILDSATKSLKYIYDNFSGKMDGLTVIHEDGYIKLGGNALVSMAMLKCYQMHKKELSSQVDSLKTIRSENEIYWLFQIGTDLVAYMYKCIDKETKLFTHHKRNVNTGADKEFESSFYPGEALLAMVNAHKVIDGFNENQGKPLANLGRLEETIMAYFVLRETDGHVRDHWMAQAIEKISPYVDTQFRRTVLFPYIMQIKQITIDDSPSGSAGASAARTESLLAYMRFHLQFPTPMFIEASFDRIRKIIENQLDFQASCFINRGLSEGAFRAKPGSNECRCDCTQHNISAFLGYHKLIK